MWGKKYQIYKIYFAIQSIFQEATSDAIGWGRKPPNTNHRLSPFSKSFFSSIHVFTEPDQTGVLLNYLLIFNKELWDNHFTFLSKNTLLKSVSMHKLLLSQVTKFSTFFMLKLSGKSFIYRPSFALLTAYIQHKSIPQINKCQAYMKHFATDLKALALCFIHGYSPSMSPKISYYSKTLVKDDCDMDQSIFTGFANGCRE